MSTITRVHRIVIESYPTPDGKPFDQQDHDDYEAAVDYFHNPIEENAHAVPAWLAEIDMTERLYADDGGWGAVQLSGATIMSGSEPLLTVPVLRRVQFFSRAAAVKRLSYLTDWGAVGYVESSAPVEWPAQ